MRPTSRAKLDGVADPEALWLMATQSPTLDGMSVVWNQKLICPLVSRHSGLCGTYRMLVHMGKFGGQCEVNTASPHLGDFRANDRLPRPFLCCFYCTGELIFSWINSAFGNLEDAHRIGHEIGSQRWAGLAGLKVQMRQFYSQFLQLLVRQGDCFRWLGRSRLAKG